MISAANTDELDTISSALEYLFVDGISEGMHHSIQCREEMPFESPEKAIALSAELPPQLVAGDFYDPAFVFNLCQSWDSGEAGSVENEAVVSDIPTLVLAGQYDPVTPPAWARLAAETLSNSFYYEFPGIGRGVIRSDRRGLTIALQFLDNPTTEPDATCINELSSPSFE
jgi:pimeloyl-ACP methyl ester carboxylesterase